MFKNKIIFKNLSRMTIKEINELLNFLNVQKIQEQYDFFSIAYMLTYLSKKGFKVQSDGKCGICDAFLYRISKSYIHSFNKKNISEQFIKYLRESIGCQICDIIEDDDIISAICTVFNINITIFEQLLFGQHPTVQIYAHNIDTDTDTTNNDYENKSMLYFAKSNDQYFALNYNDSSDIKEHLKQFSDCLNTTQ